MTQALYQTYSRRTPGRGYRFHLLSPGSTNPKMKKHAGKLGLDPMALSLAPFNVSGAGNVCPSASPGCAAVCLNYAGRGQMSNVQKARIQKTRFWFSDRQGFLELLTRDSRTGPAAGQPQRPAGRGPSERLFRYSLGTVPGSGTVPDSVLRLHEDFQTSGQRPVQLLPNVQLVGEKRIRRTAGPVPGLQYSGSLPGTSQAVLGLSRHRR